MEKHLLQPDHQGTAQSRWPMTSVVSALFLTLDCRSIREGMPGSLRRSRGPRTRVERYCPRGTGAIAPVPKIYTFPQRHPLTPRLKSRSVTSVVDVSSSGSAFGVCRLGFVPWFPLQLDHEGINQWGRPVPDHS